MKLSCLCLVALTLATRLALAGDGAELSIYLFDQDQPVAGAEVRVDGQALGRTDAHGVVLLRLPAGAHALQIQRGQELLLELPLALVDAENAQLIATLRGDAAPELNFESSHRGAIEAPPATTAETAGPPGTLQGRIVSQETGQPVAAARVFISGTPLDVVSDADGRFQVPLSAGSYSISILAGNFSTQTIDGIAIVAGATQEQIIELTPAGVELPEFVVLEPFVEGSLAAFVEEKRSSSAVADILGAEQISRAGDSDAAGALKRVTGLTLVDGKFVYVRGLGERYSSVVLNGAQIPSPDPTRRVVPLDLFPTEILAGILVQKTYSADMPGEFGGGTIQLRTRGVPESRLLRGNLGLGYAQGTTGDDGLRYTGGERDWSGFDDGTRAAPAGLLGPSLPTEAAALEALGEDLADPGWALQSRQLGPNGSSGFTLGDDFNFADSDWRLGYIGSFRYSHSWDSRSEQRRGFSTLASGQLVPLFEFQRDKTERAIDSGLFLSAGLAIGEQHAVTATAFQVRQTVDQAQIDDGLQSSGNIERQFKIEWVENELTTRQLGGEHSLPALGNLALSWQYTDSSAGRVAPNVREYNFSLDEGDDAFYYNGQNFIRFDVLDDGAEQGRLDLRWPWQLGAAATLTLQAGVDRVERQRDSSIQRYAYRGGRPNGLTSIDQVLTPDNIFQRGSQGLRLQRSTQATDAYSAAQVLQASYLATDLQWGDWRGYLGLRQEANDQEVRTQPLFSASAQPVIGRIDAVDRLPAAALTWAYSAAAQLRLGYSETVSRPDFRELSEAPFIDPLLDIRVQGNPNLRPAEIESRDLRWEYYFSPSESLSVAYFEKDFRQPIELVRVPASGELLGIRNADTAQNRGIEIDYYRSFAGMERLGWLPAWLSKLPWEDLFLGANYARIDSEIDLGSNRGTQTNAQRPLQGQSPYVVNLSLSYLPVDAGIEASLLYNLSGARISQVGDSGLPDIYEQPFDQLDFTLSSALPWDGWKAKLRLRNLLDPEAEFTVGDQTSRRYRKGRELAFSVEWRY